MSTQVLAEEATTPIDTTTPVGIVKNERKRAREEGECEDDEALVPGSKKIASDVVLGSRAYMDTKHAGGIVVRFETIAELVTNLAYICDLAQSQKVVVTRGHRLRLMSVIAST